MTNVLKLLLHQAVERVAHPRNIFNFDKVYEINFAHFYTLNYFISFKIYVTSSYFAVQVHVPFNFSGDCNVN